MASLRLYIIPDPLSREGRTSEEYPINPKDLTVANYLPLEFLEGYTITLGSRGELGADELQTATIDPEGDSLTVTPAVGLDPGTWAAIGGWIAAHWVAVAMVILTFATSLYSMLAARKMATGAGDQDLDSSPTYGWNGVETTAAVDVPVAVILGENIVGGNIINAFVENDGEDSYLKAIIAIGEGPLNSICGITEDTDDADLDAIGDKLKLDSNPADNLNGLRVYVRMGTNDQEPIPGFGKLHRMTNLNQELDYEDTDGYRFDTDPARPCDAVRLNLRIDSLFRNHKAEMEETELRVEVAYKKQGADGGFTQAGQFLKNAKYLSPRYFTHELKFPERGAYTVRLIKKNGNSDEEYTRNITLTAVDEVVSEELAYPNTALLAIKIKATSQLSGSLSDVTMWVEGLKNVKQWDGSSWVRKYTRNAIWNMMHAIENEDYGIGKFIPESGRDWEAAKLEAAYCAEKMLLPGETEPQERYFLDMVVDSKMSAFDCLSKMGAAFNCIPYWGASAVLPIIEKPSLPVFPFGESNIVGGTFKLGYSSLSKRKNRVEIQFRNAEHEFKRDLVLREDEESLAAGEPERTNTIFIPGIVRPRQAVMVASQYMKTEKYITRSIGFEAGFGAALCQPGDVVEVAHRVPRWALTSGRITEAGTSGGKGWVKVNREVTLEAGKTYFLRVAHAEDNSRYEYPLETAAGTYPPGTILSITAGWTKAPTGFDMFTIRDTQKAVKLMRIMSLKRTQKGRVQVEGAEYDARVYDTSDHVVPDPAYTELPDPRRIPAGVTNLQAYNSAAGALQVVVSWTNSLDQSTYTASGMTSSQTPLVDHYEIWVSTDGVTFFPEGISPGDRWVKAGGLHAGQKYWFKVLAVSRLGRKSSLDAAQVASLTVRSSAPPPNVEGLEIFGKGNLTTWEGKELKLRWRAAANGPATDLLGEASGMGAGSGTPDRYFQDYLVEVWSADISGRPRRSEAVRDPAYTYSFEKNIEDGGSGGPIRNLTIKVWARDIFNQKSAVPAILNVTNPMPAAPTGLQVVSSIKSFFVKWDAVADTDLAGYQLRKVSGTGDPWTLFQNGTVVYDGPSTQAVVAAAQSGETAKFVVGAYDVFYKEFSAVSALASATAGTVAPTDIDTFYESISSTFNNVPVPNVSFYLHMQGHEGECFWPAHDLWYQGTKYQISIGWTTLKYIFWDSASPTFYQSSNTHPGAKDGLFIIATFVGGVPTKAFAAIANEMIGSAYIQNAAIISAKIAEAAIDNAHIKDAAIESAKINTLHGSKILAGTITADKLTIGMAHTYRQEAIPVAESLGDVWYQTNASNQVIGFYRAAAAGADAITAGEWEAIDPATIINNGSTTIDGGKIIVSGTSTLADWRYGSDTTKIDGGKIATNTIQANRLEIGLRGVRVEGITFAQHATDANTVTWTAGYMNYIDDAGTPTRRYVQAGSAAYTTAGVYVYWVKGSTSLSSTTDYATAFGVGVVPLCFYAGGGLITTSLGRTVIDGDLIRTGSIVANHLAAGSVTADKIQAGAVDATKVTVTSLSALSGNMGTLTSGKIELAISGQPTQKLRLDSQGIYVSKDSGTTWRKFLAADAQGNLTLSFDFLDAGAKIADMFTDWKIVGTDNKGGRVGTVDLNSNNSLAFDSSWLYVYTAEEFLTFTATFETQSLSGNSVSFFLRVIRKSDSAILWEDARTFSTNKLETAKFELNNIIRLGLDAQGAGNDASGYKVSIGWVKNGGGVGGARAYVDILGATVQKRRLTKE